MNILSAHRYLCIPFFPVERHHHDTLKSTLQYKVLCLLGFGRIPGLLTWAKQLGE
jgi:hypothetical protein